MPVARDSSEDEVMEQEPARSTQRVKSSGERNKRQVRHVRRHVRGQTPAVDPNPPDWDKAPDDERRRHGLPGKKWQDRAA